MTSTAKFQLSSMVHDYYREYQHIWDAVVGETLQCHCKNGNVYDPYAVNIKKVLL